MTTDAAVERILQHSPLASGPTVTDSPANFAVPKHEPEMTLNVLDADLPEPSTMPQGGRLLETVGDREGE
jgi:hypothetical protein